MIEIAAAATAGAVAGYAAKSHGWFSWPFAKKAAPARKPAKKGKGSVVVKHTAPTPLNTMAPRKAKAKAKKPAAKRKGSR